MGLGVNAHVGYNEPAVPYDSLTHRQKLTDKTRRQLAASFGSEEDAPRYAWTMGIKTLVGKNKGKISKLPAELTVWTRTDLL